MTHDDLVSFSAGWLRGPRRYPVVLSDVRVAVTSEQPDVIGWTNAGFSAVVECKASRADFQRDEKKWFRRAPEIGMGYERWFCAPPGLLDGLILPDGWGLVEPNGKRACIVRKPTPFYERNDRCERALLVNALRRATEGWGRRMFGADAPLGPDGDPHPTASKTIRVLREENMRLKTALRESSERRSEDPR